mmetsp:Transcript_140108/g.355294  ORF Transcript_140108/g.355294 Transcript_140108/m.355294 type:complete len:307 (+) Transcript_140108:424-1344(+)
MLFQLHPSHTSRYAGDDQFGPILRELVEENIERPAMKTAAVQALHRALGVHGADVSDLRYPGGSCGLLAPHVRNGRHAAVVATSSPSFPLALHHDVLHHTPHHVQHRLPLATPAARPPAFPLFAFFSFTFPISFPIAFPVAFPAALPASLRKIPLGAILIGPYPARVDAVNELLEGPDSMPGWIEVPRATGVAIIPPSLPVAQALPLPLLDLLHERSLLIRVLGPLIEAKSAVDCYRTLVDKVYEGLQKGLLSFGGIKFGETLLHAVIVPRLLVRGALPLPGLHSFHQCQLRVADWHHHAVVAASP